MKKKKTSKRPRVGIVLDYSLRIPNFKESYLKFKEQILVGVASASNLEEEDILDENNFWEKEKKLYPEMIEFYSKTPIPNSNWEPGFDLTYTKYFFNKDHLSKFLEEWSFNLFGQGIIANKADINIVNLAQSKLFDIVLLDVITHTRKVANTFAFLSKSGLFIKEVKFISEGELKSLSKEFLAIWNPFSEESKVIENVGKFEKPTQKLLDWFMGLEAKLKNDD